MSIPMRQKNPKKTITKRLTITYKPGELDPVDIQHAAFDLDFGSMSKLLINLIQKFMEEHETEKNGRKSA